jgi:serine/threonine protein kinase
MLISAATAPSLIPVSPEEVERRLLHSGQSEGVVSRLNALCKEVFFDRIPEVIRSHQERFLSEMNVNSTGLERSRITQLQPLFDEVGAPKRRILCLEGIQGLTAQFFTKCPKGPIGAFKQMRQLIPFDAGMCRNIPLILAKIRTMHRKETLPEGIQTPLSQKEFCQEEINNFFKEAPISDMLHASGARYIVKIWRVQYQKKERSTERLLIEYCDKDHLLSYLRTETDVLTRMKLGLQFVEGLLGMHERGFCHGDLKGNNIFVKTVDGQAQVRIGDFGNCRRIGEIMGPYPTFPAPETFLSGGRIPVQPSLDLWGVGDVLFFLRFGYSILNKNRMVFSENPDVFLQKAKELKNSLSPMRKKWKEPLVDCIARLFNFQPERRVPMSEVVIIVREWVRGQESIRTSSV